MTQARRRASEHDTLSPVSARPMRPLLLASAVLACCVTPRSASGASEPPALPAQPARPVAVERTPCPLQAPRAPACRFTPVDGAVGGAVRRVARPTCPPALTPAFTGSGSDTVLSLVFHFTEGKVPVTVATLHQVDGRFLPVPAELSSAFLVGDALVGLTQTARGQAFWRDGVCESPMAGQVLSIAPLGTGDVAAVVETRTRGQEVMVRDARGEWSTFGAVAAGSAPRLSASAGRVAVYFQDVGHASAWEHGVLFPDLRRTEIVRRRDVTPRVVPHPVVTPGELRPGSRFAFGVTVELDEDGTLAVDRYRPGRSYERLPVAQFEPLPGCRRDVTGRARFATRTAPAIATLRDGTALVALVESAGECEGTVLPPEPVRCAPGQPCRAPPPRWKLEELSRTNTLVLWTIGSTAREALRVRLASGAAAERYLIGVSLAVTDERIFAWAGGHLVELDRAALEPAR